MLTDHDNSLGQPKDSEETQIKVTYSLALSATASRAASDDPAPLYLYRACQCPKGASLRLPCKMTSILTQRLQFCFRGYVTMLSRYLICKCRCARLVNADVYSHIIEISKQSPFHLTSKYSSHQHPSHPVHSANHHSSHPQTHYRSSAASFDPPD